MYRDHYGLCSFSDKELFDALYTGKIDTLDNIVIYSDHAWPFNRAKMLNGDKFPEIHGPPYERLYTIEEMVQDHRKKWFISENYSKNLEGKILSKCSTKEQFDRVHLELNLYIKYNMLDLLYFLDYLVETLRQHKIVWGVGRGSSVSSYVLYLLGVHKIDSLKYDLDINEFFKEEKNGQSI